MLLANFRCRKTRAQAAAGLDNLPPAGGGDLIASTPHDNSGSVPPDQRPASADGGRDSGPAMGDNRFQYWKLILAILAVIGAAVIVYWPLLSAPTDHLYPWGSDTWGHLYKAEFLFRQMARGNYFPRFTADWYNGCQPFRYWAPLPYYVLALIRYLTGNIFVAGNYYLFACALIGGLSWLTLTSRLGSLPAAFSRPVLQPNGAVAAGDIP